MEIRFMLLTAHILQALPPAPAFVQIFSGSVVVLTKNFLWTQRTEYNEGISSFFAVTTTPSATKSSDGGIGFHAAKCVPPHVSEQISRKRAGKGK